MGVAALFVILNLFQHSASSSPVVLKRVQHDSSLKKVLA